MRIKKLIAVALCFVMCAIFSFAVSAAPTPQITLTNAAAFPGEEVTINVLITNNPGIMSMAFSLKYDKNNFEFISCDKGYVSTPTYKNHADKGYVAFVISETTDKINSGIIISATFKVKRSAKPNTYPVMLANSNPEKYGTNIDNSFANSKEDIIVPAVKQGSIRVKGECDISGHKFGDWTELTPASCDTLGLKQRTCTVCQTKEEQNIPFTHDFENDWTVDKAATPELDGIMSRHCTKCDVITDEITFTYKEITGEENEDDTTSNENTSSVDNTSSNITSSSNDTSSDTTSSNDNATSNTNTSSDATSSANTSSNGPLSSENTSSDVSSATGTTSNVSSTNTSSNDNTTSEDSLTSEDTSSNNSTSNENTSSQSKPSKKPIINNVPGEKVPQTEAEKLDQYDVVIPPVEEEPESTDNTTSSSTTSTLDTSNADIQSNAAQTNGTTEEQSFLSTTAGIITLVLCALLSVGILAVAVLLILKNRKEN